MKPLLAALLLFPVGAYAASAPRTNVTRLKAGSSFKLLDGIALNATASTRTIDVEIGPSRAEWAKVSVIVDYTYTAATTVVATPTCSQDGTLYASFTSRSISSGAAAVSPLVDTYTTGGANATYILEYDVRSCKNFKIVFSGASAGASDLVDVYAAVIVGD